jgi:glycosyltransferase involved in cell wall biosynthesis
MMRVAFRLSSLGFGGTERVFLSVADHLSTEYGWITDFVVDEISGAETESVAATMGHDIVGLGARRTLQSILPFADYLRRQRPDIVISAYTDTNAAALISNAVNRFRTPIVVTEHASLDQHWAGKPLTKRLVLEFFVRVLYRLADRIVCVSRGLADQLGERLPTRRIDYIYNPVRFDVGIRSKSASRGKLGIVDETRVILSVGRISRPKNYLMLLRALKLCLATPDVHLYVVGGVFESNEKQCLDQFIAEQHLGRSVTFVDFTHDLEAYYAAADVLVLSSAWEGFGNVLVEALAFGLPIVSTRCKHGPQEILDYGRFGVLVDIGDHEAMAQAIQDILKRNPFDPRDQMERAREFSEQSIGEQYRQLIMEAIDGRYDGAH